MSLARTRPADAPAPRTVTVLGATGSVGRNTLDLVARNPDAFAVEALTAWRDVAGLAELAVRFRPRLAVIGDAACHSALRAALSGTGIATAAGPAALIEAAARPAELVMAAIVGSAGLAPTLAAVRRGAVVALANKECLVSAGDTMLAEVRRCGATLLPVDSEHNAIFQVFDAAQPDSVEKLILTASGGPFRTFTREQMAAVTPAQAVAHPNWSMGAKISVDSATMMNKGLELIEAARLFPVPSSAIEILVHPQSVIHSMVAYVDGSVLAQLGAPDMRTPIAHALAWPRRMVAPSPRLDLASIGSLTFEPPDPERFPALRLAREALAAGRGAPAVLNAANEVAVAGFLAGRVGFLAIAGIVEVTLEALGAPAAANLDEVFAIDAAARRHADGLVAAAG
ncbi:MAG: 1-deoxy-D-xylulose-5-phosphate reductoisomerase [Alphaproteobacteria bacterium]